MPPKPKCTKEEIAQTALDIIKTKGSGALTARELGKRLSVAASSIFTLYSSMDEVRSEARKIALYEFDQYISDYKEYSPAFKKIGMMMVKYGAEYPELFKLLFMQEHSDTNSFKESIYELGDTLDECIKIMKKDYALDDEKALMLYENLWLYAFGMGAMCAYGVCKLSEREIGERLARAFASNIMFIKSEKSNMIFSDVEKNSMGIFHGYKVDDIPF